MIVLDACAAIEMVFQSAEGIALREVCIDEEIVSCTLFGAEAASVVRKAKRMGKLSNEDAWNCYDDAISLIDTFYPIEELQHEAFRESVRLDHSVYDMFYFVLARRTGGTLVTTDRKLIDLCVANHVDCIAFVDDF